MKCAQFEDLITDYLDGELPDSERRDFERHRQSCAACPELLEQVRKVIVLCRAFPEAEPPITLPERILSATLGEQRKISLRSFFDLANLRRLLNPQFAVGLALILCTVGLGVRLAKPTTVRNRNASPAILTKLDAFTHRIYSEGMKLYTAKNRIVAEYDYLKTTLFNQIDYHLSQITGQLEDGEEEPSPPSESPSESEEGEKSSLITYFV